MTNIDQQTRRRIIHTGLTAIDKERSSAGYTLYTPMNGSGIVYLIDEEGIEVHRWEMPYQPGLYGYLLPNGNLFYMGRVRDDTWERFPQWSHFKGGILMEVNWNGKVVWEHRDKDHHHDARRTSSGGAIYLNIEKLPNDIVDKVRGGVTGSDENGMWSDVIVEVDSEGKRIWEWHAFEHLDFKTDTITYNDPRDEWTHANTVVPLDNDRVMVSFRNISTIGIIEKKTGDFVWKIGPEILAQQHDPSMLQNGNVLVFDNGSFHKNDARISSRVIEINPSTNQIVWEYRDQPWFNFFSAYISGARRLPNGNTLITEGMFGRIFQVTADKEVVWEYISPYFVEGPGGIDNSVFRATHYLPEDIPTLVHD